MKNLCGALILLFVLAGTASAEIVEVVPGFRLNLDLAGEPWVLSSEAPPFLVKELAEHLEHEVPPGQSVAPDKLLQLVHKRLQANELFLFNPHSGAHLEIDFSPLRKDEKEPSRRAVADSARYAGEGLAEEEGVDNVEWKTRKLDFPGSKVAYRLDASYTVHGTPRRFIGIIGFASPYWFYLYYTDPLKGSGDVEAMERLIDRLSLERVKKD